jgi:hypothetical protein
MAHRLNETTPRRAAIIAGIGYSAIFVLAIFANFVVRTGLVDPDSAATTFQNIVGSEMLFRGGLIGFLVIFLVDIVIAWALYVLFRAISPRLSLLTAWFRLVYTVFLGVAIIFFFGVLALVGGADYLSAFGQDQLDAQVTLLLEAFNSTWLVGLAAFGGHLILIGYLMVKSQFGPRVLGVLLGIAGTAYIVDTVAYGLMANYADYADLFLGIVAVPSVLAELGFTIWLLWKAGRETAPDSAALDNGASTDDERLVGATA